MPSQCKTLAIGFVGMVVFWGLFWLLGATAYYDVRLNQHWIQLQTQAK